MLWIFTILSVFLTAANCSDVGCTSISGTCQEDNLYCSGNYESGLCSGHAARRCCVPQGSDAGCTAISGTCQDDNLYCSGNYESGLCSGNAARRCCVPQGSDAGCTSISGTCQDDNLYCSGNYESGLCSGNAARRCCVPQGCSYVNIVSRSQWGAREPNDVTNIDTPVDEFFIHHTESASCQTQSECSSIVRGIQNYHMDNRGWSDIGYSFLVGEDGNVYEGRGWSHVGAHTSGYNSQSFAASMIGSYTNQLPNSQALTAVKNLIACGVEQGKIAGDYRLYGHRDAGQTNCPGDALYNEIKTWPHYSYTNP